MGSRKWNTAPTLRDHNPNFDQWAIENSVYRPQKKPKHGKDRRSVWDLWKRLWRVRCKDGWTNVEYCRENYLFDYCDSVWLDFERFFDDVGPMQPGRVFCRPDMTRPYGPDNFQWVDRSEQATNSISPKKAYKICERVLEGESPTSVARMEGVCRGTVYRIIRGETHPGLYNRLKFLHDEFE